MKNKILIALASVVLAIVVWVTAPFFMEKETEEELLTEWEEIDTLGDTSWEYDDTETQTRESEEIPKVEWTSLGRFRFTAYCNCTKCCGKWSGGATASGTMPQAGRTIAVDTSIIPFGTEVMINGHIYIAEDTGSGIDGNCIDIYFDSHQAALEFGLQYGEAFIKK